MNLQNKRSRSCLSRLFWGILAAFLFVLVVLIHPVWIYEKQTQFCLSDAKLREAKYLLGVQYRSDEEKPTPVSGYLLSIPLPKADRKWVPVCHRGVLFPTDLLKWYHRETPRYGMVLSDMNTLEYLLERRANLRLEEKKYMAGRYMSYLRKGDPQSATMWLFSILEKDLRESDVGKGNSASRDRRDP